jgi:hypothetical protein
MVFLWLRNGLFPPNDWRFFGPSDSEQLAKRGQATSGPDLRSTLDFIGFSASFFWGLYGFMMLYPIQIILGIHRYL